MEEKPFKNSHYEVHNDIERRLGKLGILVNGLLNFLEFALFLF